MPWTMTDSERIFSFNLQWCGPSADTTLTAKVAQIGSGTSAFGRLLMNDPCKGPGWFMGAAWASSSGTARSQHGVIGYQSQLKTSPSSKTVPAQSRSLLKTDPITPPQAQSRVPLLFGLVFDFFST
jgi:hypothetical protein